MTGRNLLIVGAGGHAKVVADLVRALGWRVDAFLDTTQPSRAGESFCGSTVVTAWPDSTDDLRHAVVAVGDAAARVALATHAMAERWTLPVMAHQSAVIAETAVLGPGTVVMAHATIQADAELGVACLVNTGAIVEHDCSLGTGVHVAPAACLCGQVLVGDLTLIGAGAVVREKIQIGARVVVGAGAVVVTDLDDDVRAMGVPAVVRV